MLTDTVTLHEQNACFSEWLNEHAAVLHHVANGFAEGADRHDLLQELMLAVWRAVPAFRSSARPSTFIYRVAHNAALTWKRGQRNYQQRVDQFESLQEKSDAPGRGNERERETLVMVYRAIRQLPLIDRSLILLHLDEVSYAEMAEIHGLTESNVGVRLNRIKQKLSESLKEVAHELR
jgi:RNA polymerase sigma factor (sigma-70 family)